MYGVNPKVSGTGPRGVCDECFGGQNRAADCPEFEPVRDAADIRKDFDGFLTSATKGEIAFHYPDIAALLWALGDHPDLESILPDDEAVQLVEVEEASEVEPEHELAVIEESWWQRLWRFIRG